MAKKKRSKPLETNRLQERYERIMEGFEQPINEVPEIRTAPRTTTEYVIVRDYVTYSAYEDPIEG